MDNEIEFNFLVSDILDSNSYSHCRLCLERITDDQFAKFHDNVAYSTSEESLELNSILNRIFGTEVCDIITGLDAVCSNCLEKSLETYKFIQQYEVATQKLHKTLDTLTTILNDDIDVSNESKAIYIVCNKEESQLIFVQKEDKKPVDKFSYKCNTCNEILTDIDMLIEHNRNHGLFTCEKCKYTSKNEADVLEHEQSSSFFKCASCPQFRCTEESLKEHEVENHGMQVCKECGKSFRGMAKLMAHEQKHIVKNECPKCGKTYTTKEFFEKHVTLCLEDRIEQHPMRSRIVKTNFCQHCGKGYSTPGGLRVHERFVHGNAKYHICKECGKMFTAPCYLKAHKVTHTKEKNFPCDLCQGRFVSKEALLYHRRRHVGDKPYSCNECGEKFVNASARFEHIKFKHIGPTLSCEICSRKFVTKNILRIHMKKHYDPLNKLYIGRADVPHNATDKNVKNEIIISFEE